MAYTAQKLITRALYLSGVVSRNLQTPTGQQIQDGLDMLNDLLNFKQIEIDLIPYYTYIELQIQPNVEFYYLPYVALIESATFNLNTVRFEMQSTTRRQYYGSARIDDISALPFSYNFERALGGGNLALYFKPQENYPVKMMVKLFLADVSLDTDLSDISVSVPYTFINSANQGYDSSYIEYLRYALARYICSEYGIIFNPESDKILRKMESQLMYVSPPDLSNFKTSVLNSSKSSSYPNFGDVNLGKGWRPS